MFNNATLMFNNATLRVGNDVKGMASIQGKLSEMIKISVISGRVSPQSFHV